MDTLDGQICPMCGEKKLTLMEDEMDIPYFGKAYLFSMKCSGCDFEKGDVEAAEPKGKVKIVFVTESEEDMKVRVVKSSAATVSFPQLRMKIEPGPDAIGFVTNVEGLLNRVEKVVEGERDAADEPAVRKRAKNLLKKIRKIKYGDEQLKIIIEDPTGNSAIVSERAEVSKK